LTQYILHIGMHKTGTTSIQKFLAAHRDALLAAGIDYPFTGRTNDDGSFHYQHYQLANFIGGKSVEVPQNFNDEGAISEAPVCILSSETFYNHNNSASVSRARQLLVGDVKVVCYVRDPVSHIRSHYMQALKRLEIVQFQEFIRQNIRKLQKLERTSFYCYDENLAYWRNTFDLTEVAYRRNYQIEDFFRDCGLADRFIPPPGSAMKAENRGFSDTTAVLLQRLNHSFFQQQIDIDRYNGLKAALFQMNDSYAALHIKDKMQMAEIDMTAYKSAFALRNPNQLACLEGTPDSITVLEECTLEDKEIFQIIDSFAMERSSRK